MNILMKAKRFISQVNEIYHRIDRVQNALGRIESRQLQRETSGNIKDTEFQVYSQWGEDGIIQFLINNVPIDQRTFVEFGVENYIESNTRFLLQNNNWSGLVIDGSAENIAFIKNDPIYWKHNLKAECAFVDCENINDLLQKNGITDDIGLLSIDIDGNDYWVWTAIETVRPRLVICEYNSLFGPSARVTIPYDRSFQRTKAHYSNLYFGASINALDYLARKKGYSLVYANSAGCNAFFVRDDVRGKLHVCPPHSAYVKAQFRESRDINGNLLYLGFSEALRMIEELPLYDLDTNAIINVKNILLNV